MGGPSSPLFPTITLRCHQALEGCGCEGHTLIHDRIPVESRQAFELHACKFYFNSSLFGCRSGHLFVERHAALLKHAARFLLCHAALLKRAARFLLCVML